MRLIFNYSSVINFDENSFVKAGIGAIRGIKKCFSDIGQYTFEDCINTRRIILININRDTVTLILKTFSDDKHN